MAEFFQVVVGGIYQGSLYALVGVGFVLVYRATKVINFAQGELVALGAYMSLTLVKDLALPFALAAVLVAVGGAVAGAVLNFAVILPLKWAQRRYLIASRDDFITIVGTLAFALILGNLLKLNWGPFVQYTAPTLPGPPIRFGDVGIARQQVVVFVAACVLAVLLWLLLRGTTLGLAMRAVGQNARAARIVGVTPRTVMTAAVVVSAVICAIAGLVSAPLTGVYPAMGMLLMMYGFAAAVVGGFGSPFGALWGGLAVGVSTALYAGYVHPRTADVAMFAAILCILAVRPTGLIAEYGTKR